MEEPENTNAAIKCEEVGREEEKNSHGRLSNSCGAITCSDAQEEKTWSLGELKLGRTHHCSHTSTHTRDTQMCRSKLSWREGCHPGDPIRPLDVCVTQLWHFPFPTSRPHLEGAFYPSTSYKEENHERVQLSQIFGLT